MDFATKQLLIIDKGLSLSMTVGRAVAHFKLVCLMPHFFPSLFSDKFPKTNDKKSDKLIEEISVDRKADKILANSNLSNRASHTLPCHSGG